MKKRLLSLLLAAVLCLSLLPAGALARETEVFRPLPVDVNFASFTFDRSCIDRLYDCCGQVPPLLGDFSNIEALCGLFDEILELYVEIVTQQNLITVFYYQEPAVYGQAYRDMSGASQLALNEADETLRRMYSDPQCGPTLRSYGGEAEYEAVMGRRPLTERRAALQERETELVMEYHRAAALPDVTEAYGRQWTEQSLMAGYYEGSLSLDQYWELLRDIYEMKNQRLGEIYLQLVALRREIAGEQGYEDYSRYIYETTYHRDYSPAEAAAFCDEVKKSIAPLYRELYRGCNLGCFRNGVTYDGASEETLLTAIAPCVERISDELADSLAYMRRCDLVDAEYSDTKLSLSYTMPLPGYGVPYVSCDRVGGNSDMRSLIHEFGHFNAMIYGTQNNMDIMEVHSQGLEALQLAFAEELYGAEAQSQTGFQLMILLNTIVEGCLYDELQRYAYGVDTLSLEALNQKCAQLREEYGQTGIIREGQDYEWVTVLHTYERPLYYISYAVSGVTALELYVESCDSLEAAADRYLKFTASSEAAEGIRSLAIDSGLGDPLNGETLEYIAQQLPACLEKQVYKTPFGDLEQCWAQRDIALVYLLGVMDGVSEETFAPEECLSRAMAVTVLYRLVGDPNPGADGHSGFADVPADTWYTQAVDWAVARGVVEGTAPDRFSPEESVSFQELAVMLYRLLLKEQEESEGETTWKDAADWAINAMAWSERIGIFETERELESAATPITRGELAAAVINILE